MVVLSSNLRLGRLSLRAPVRVAKVRMQFKERWPEQVLQVMKEEMLVDVTSPAIPLGLRLRTKREEKIQVSTERRVDVRGRQAATRPSGVWFCLSATLARPIHSLPFLPPQSPSALPTASPPGRTTSTRVALGVVDGSTTLYHSSPGTQYQSGEQKRVHALYSREFLHPF